MDVLLYNQKEEKQRAQNKGEKTMKITKIDYHMNINNSSSFKVYVCKTREQAEDIMKVAMSMIPKGREWYAHAGCNEIKKDCRVPAFFHDLGLWVAAMEHNNGDWNSTPDYELYIVE